MMVFGLSIGSCYPFNLLTVNIALLCVDGVLALIAFFQLIRIHLRDRQTGWTRQKVLHLIIGSSNLGYCIYFVSALVASCKRWKCWSYACGFILMACPKIMFLAAFLLLLSFWVDLCHQANDEEEDDEESSVYHVLPEDDKSKPGSKKLDGRRKCCPFQGIHIGSRQKIVIFVVVIVFILMMSTAVFIVIGAGDNPIDSAVVARVYIDFFAAAILTLGGGLGSYGLLLFFKLRKVRSEQASSEIWKISGLALVSVVCFTSSALVALLTDIPLFYHWNLMEMNAVNELVFLVIYYFIGSSLPSAFVLWVMRELPPPETTPRQVEPTEITYFSYEVGDSETQQNWTATTMSKNQVSRASPI